MPSDAERLVQRMDDFVAGLPVRWALSVDSGFEVSIQRLSTAPDARRQGHARAVLIELTAQADELGVDIELEALPEEDDGIALEALADLYRSVGFDGEVDDDEGSVRMSRSSRTPYAPRA